MATNWILSKRRYKLAPMADPCSTFFSTELKRSSEVVEILWSARFAPAVASASVAESSQLPETLVDVWQRGA
jgi:hypothetical protein